MNLNEPISDDDIENEKLELIMLSFETSDELIKGTRAFFLERGYGLSIRSSRKDKYVVLGCDRGGCYRDQRNVSIDQIKRTTASRLIDCPFKIKGKRQDNGLWMIEIKNYLHNHEASVDVTGHPICRRLSQEEIRSVDHMSKSGIPLRQIISSLRQNNPKLSAISKTIYNAKKKIRKDNLAGRSVIQALLEELAQGSFMYDILNEGGHLTHLFFAHPLSVKLTQNFPNIFIMDCTYKTNRYKMPLLDIIGISSSNTSFYSSFAFLKGESEKDYIWALKMFSKILGEKQPYVIITDREFALINAINIVFPECKHLLCVWHIEKNILTKCKKYFETEEIWVGFLSSWKNVVYSSTELEYKEHWKEFESKYMEKKKALEYIENVWLPLKEKFVGAWTDQYLHFGNRASSRAESAHAKLKKYLQVSTGDLYEVRSKMCLAIENEFNEIKWRIDGRSLSVYAATHNDDHDDGFDVILEELRTKYQEWPASTKDTARERIKELINQFDVPFEPITRPPKGRPPKSKNKRKAVSSTRRDPSGFEFVKASRRSGLGEGLDDGNASLFDLNVSSSMWE
ncbi:protein FAR1-RELATED SEQUENCE 5-like [Carex rostrata]